MTALVFLDTETTGLSLADDIWEIAAVRREDNGDESEFHRFVQHDRFKCRRLPDSFLLDHENRWPAHQSGVGTHSPRDAAVDLLTFIGKDRPHIVGAVPNFDTERLLIMMRRSIDPEMFEPWHYHLIDVETLAVGFLGRRPLPWDSDELSLAVGVTPDEFPRHTAMGDVRWAMAIYDAVMAR